MTWGVFGRAKSIERCGDWCCGATHYCMPMLSWLEQSVYSCFEFLGDWEGSVWVTATYVLSLILVRVRAYTIPVSP